MLRSVQRGDFRPPRQLDPSIDQALEAVCLKAMAHRAGGPLRRPRGRWPRTSSGGWPTSRSRPGASRSSRRARRWATRNRTAVTGGGGGAAGRGGRAVGGAGRADAGQGRHRPVAADAPTTTDRANAELARSKAAVQARYDLAVEAIKTFHTGVSEDFLLKEEPVQGAARPAAEVGRGLLRQARGPARQGDGPGLAAGAGGRRTSSWPS